MWALATAVSIENCNEDVKPFHDILMEVDIVFLEVLKNLEELSTDTFFMSYTPLPLIGADSMPVRAYAIEGLQIYCIIEGEKYENSCNRRRSHGFHLWRTSVTEQ